MATKPQQPRVERSDVQSLILERCGRGVPGARRGESVAPAKQKSKSTLGGPAATGVGGVGRLQLDEQWFWFQVGTVGLPAAFCADGQWEPIDGGAFEKGDNLLVGGRVRGGKEARWLEYS